MPGTHVFHQQGDAVDDRAGLAGARARQHQHRPTRVHDDRELLGVQLARVVRIAAHSRCGLERNPAHEGLGVTAGEFAVEPASAVLPKS